MDYLAKLQDADTGQYSMRSGGHCIFKKYSFVFVVGHIFPRSLVGNKKSNDVSNCIVVDKMLLVNSLN